MVWNAKIETLKLINGDIRYIKKGYAEGKKLLLKEGYKEASKYRFEKGKTTVSYSSTKNLGKIWIINIEGVDN